MSAYCSDRYSNQILINYYENKLTITVKSTDTNPINNTYAENELKIIIKTTPK